MQKSLAERFDSFEEDFQDVLSTKSMQYNSLLNANKMYVDAAKYKIWVGRVKKLLEDSYGQDSEFYKDFIKAQKGFYASNYEILTTQLKPVFDAAKADLDYALPLNTSPVLKETDRLDLIINVLERFPSFCRQLKKRYNNRDSIEVTDEYDVQDLVHALLTLHFDDVRPEEASPSYAGSSSRQDFLLKKEKIVIEVKKTRKSLGAGKIGEELIIDMARYRAHPDCDTLVCFVYDPDGWVNNPKGVVADLEGGDSEGKIRVVIAQF
ncbi:TPA: malate dehydrogenase [Citrobacter koseri]|uniref:PD-(D/E)XK nuclease domain-containing protein n=1 Tax=Citrobacter koseri TaxID=545 RepID=UPI001A31C6D7|nr:malate dehydrogenase [Citrobacter koseri]HAT8003892.1 malate dehydrogenase [Citrobacter koseri]HBL6926939.1 malate dehydrogenase [Citrobacter koseri]HBL6931293.1 malate dehydrogenase [Citrobacter koseri]HED2610153.1 malate dehydrogenase [Citrobacter koseri]HEM8555653.1 malate dehydrogenase [Citrobacter koseri]